MGTSLVLHLDGLKQEINAKTTFEISRNHANQPELRSALKVRRIKTCSENTTANEQWADGRSMDAWRLANCTMETHLDGSDIHVGFHSFLSKFRRHFR